MEFSQMVSIAQNAANAKRNNLERIAEMQYIENQKLQNAGALATQQARNQGEQSTQESKNQGDLATQESRNQGAMAEQGLRNSGALAERKAISAGDLATQGLRNKGALEVTSADIGAQQGLRSAQAAAAKATTAQTNQETSAMKLVQDDPTGTAAQNAKTVLNKGAGGTQAETLQFVPGTPAFGGNPASPDRAFGTRSGAVTPLQSPSDPYAGMPTSALEALKAKALKAKALKDKTATK
jgi:hypothetical protein